MPTTNAATKGLRQAATRARRNAKAKTSLEVADRKFRRALGTGDRAAAAESYRAVVKLADRAAGKGIIPRNRAARMKSRLAARLKALPAK